MTSSLCFLALLIAPLAAQETPAKRKRPVIEDPASTVEDFLLQGEYVAEIVVDGKPRPTGIQVEARGGGRFRATVLGGGLPGEGWDGKTRSREDGVVKDGVLSFGGLLQGATIRAGVLEIPGDTPRRSPRLARKSPTLGLKPPAGAVVLFDGTSAEAFEGGRKTADGLLQQGTQTKRLFQAGTLHIEFRTPFMPEHGGQDRGNSGCYLQGRYEVQVLDSFGLDGKHDECGGIYSVRPPDQNLCLPPLAWQTYDIDFTPARFGPDGKKTAHARMTVRHNGVLVHKDAEVDHATTASPLKEGPEPGPLHLQDHGSPVRYRNIWFVPKE